VLAVLAALSAGGILDGADAVRPDLPGRWAPRFHEDGPERIGLQGPRAWGDLSKGAKAPNEGPELGDYAGLPLNDAGRLRAESWDASILTLPEHQCKPHPAPYAFRGPNDLRITAETDPVSHQITDYVITGTYLGVKRTVWLDGRTHPPEYAAHTWGGFSTGTWQGNKLKVVTTHIKAGWLRRNGIPHSDEVVLTEYFFRHAEILTVVNIVQDPIYLTEPLVRSINWVWNPEQNPPPSKTFNPSFCGPAQIVEEIGGRDRGFVPHHLPGKNEWLTEYSTRMGIPAEAFLGGAETMFPEYQLKLRDWMKTSAPAK
jgi:hypothetical protein